MKHARLFLAAAILCLVHSTVSNAQTLHIGPSAGWLHEMPSGQESGSGLTAGVIAETDFSKNGSGWFIDAGVMFEKKKWDSSGYFNNYYTPSAGDKKASVDTWHHTTYGLKIPVSAGYKLRLSSAVKLFGAVGPYLSIGISGKSRLTTYIPSEGQYLEKQVSDNVYKDGLMNRIGWGIGAKAGAEIFGNCLVTVAYDHSMNEVFKQGFGTVKHRTLSVGLGYMF